MRWRRRPKECAFYVGERVTVTQPIGLFLGLRRYPYSEGYVRRISPDGRRMFLTLSANGREGQWVRATRWFFKPGTMLTPVDGVPPDYGQRLFGEVRRLVERCGSIDEARDILKSLVDALPEHVPGEEVDSGTEEGT